MVLPVSLLEEVDKQLLIHVCQDTIADQVYKLAKAFAVMVRERKVASLDKWLVNYQSYSVTLLQQFGWRLHRTADEAGLRCFTSGSIHRMGNDQTKDQVTKVKLIMRQMYGRAKLDLLWQRVLYRC